MKIRFTALTAGLCLLASLSFAVRPHIYAYKEARIVLATVKHIATGNFTRHHGTITAANAAGGAGGAGGAGTAAAAGTEAERYRNVGFTTVLVEPDSGLFRGMSAVIDLRDSTPATNLILKDEVAQHIALEQRGGFGG